MSETEKILIPIKYIFDLTVNDNLWKDTIITTTLFSITMVLISQLGHYFEVTNNWDRMRCRPEVMSYAWLYGKNTNKNMEYCLENAGMQIKQSNLVSPIVNNINSNYNEMNQKLNATNNNLNILKNRAKNIDTSINKQNKEIGEMMRKNIIALRESVKKVFSRLIVQNKINEGVLKTTNRTKVFTDSLRKSLAKMPEVPAPVAAPVPVAAPIAVTPVTASV
jgi:hypothetical protein